MRYHEYTACRISSASCPGNGICMHPMDGGVVGDRIKTSTPMSCLCKIVPSPRRVIVRGGVYQRSQLCKLRASCLTPEHDTSLSRFQSIIDFQVMQWSDSERSSWRSGEMVNHYINIDAGHSRVARWKVPNVESGCVRLSTTITGV